jgi:hypothetical protein
MYAEPRKSERPPTHVAVLNTIDLVPLNMATG